MNSKVKVSEFLAQFASKSTRDSYRTSLKAYFTCVYPSLSDLKDREEIRAELDKLSFEYVSSPRDYRADLIKFRDANTAKAPKTIGLAFTAVTRFLQDNELEFPSRFLKNLIPRQEAISDEFIPGPQDLGKIIEHLPIQGRALVLVLSSSGMRVGEALQVRLDDIDFEARPVRIRLRGYTTKSKSKRFTFISSESSDLLKVWLQHRPQYIETSGNRASIKKIDDGRLFPFNYSNASQMWTLGVSKAGLLKRDTETKRLTCRIHCLRKYFRTFGNWKNTDYAEILMGHKNGLMGVYAKYSEPQLAEAYLDAEKSLTLSNKNASVLKRLADQDKQIENLTLGYTNLSKILADPEDRKIARDLAKQYKEQLGDEDQDQPGG